MRGWKSRLSAGAAVLIPALALGQGAVSGRLVDRNLAAVAGVQVRLQSATVPAASDAGGRFRLDLAPGAVRPGMDKGTGLRIIAVSAGPDARRIELGGVRGRAEVSVLNPRGQSVPVRISDLRQPPAWAAAGDEAQAVVPGPAGSLRMDIPKGAGQVHGGVLFLRIGTASETGTWRMTGGSAERLWASGTGRTGPESSRRSAAAPKPAAAQDTLIFEKYGSIARKIAITPAPQDLGDVQLPFFGGPGDSLFLKGHAAYLRSKDYAGAIALFKELETRFPGTDNARSGAVYTGKSQYALDQFAAAIATLTGYLAASPAGSDAADAYYYRGRAHYQSADYAQARLDFEKVMADYPTSSESDGAAYYHARSLYQEGAYAAALKEFEAFPPAFPASGLIDYAHLQAGKCQMRLAAAGDSLRYAAAMAEFRKVLALSPVSPAFPTAQENLGECLYFQGDYAAARTELGYVEARYPAAPDVADAVYYLGRCDAQQGLFDAALARFRRVYDAFPASLMRDDAHYQVGKTLYLAGRWAEAVASLEETRSLHPASTLMDNVSLYLVRSHAKLQDCAAAKAELAEMQARFPASTLLPLAQASLTGACP